MERVFWLVSLAGDIRHQVTADSIDDAFDKMAKFHKYDSFDAFCSDLGYAAGDFTVNVVQIQPYDEDDPYGVEAKRRREEEHQGALLGAFKTIRRSMAR